MPAANVRRWGVGSPEDENLPFDEAVDAVIAHEDGTPGNQPAMVPCSTRVS